MFITGGVALAEALEIARGDMVAFVGAGGKTTSMFRLSSELSAAGMRVVATTTTHISVQQTGIPPASVNLDELEQLGRKLDRHGQCLVIGPPDGKGRVFGPGPALIARLHERSDVDVVLVEADGSRARSFKAPAAHEPVVPEATTVLVPVVGIQAIGQPLDEDHVHRADIAAALAKQPVGSPVSAETIAAVLSHPDGGARQLPSGARLVPLLNQVDSEARLIDARSAAARMLERRGLVYAVLLCAVRDDPPVREIWCARSGARQHEKQKGATNYANFHELGRMRAKDEP